MMTKTLIHSNTIQAPMRQSHGVESRGNRGGDIVSDSSPFDSLPEGCISNIISFTSPQDACVFASVSKTFESEVNSDIVWEKFLPRDYESLVPRSWNFSSKKELYFALCDNPVLIDNGKKSLWLEKGSGKICIMLPAMELYIVWADHLQYWHWILIPEARFGRVAELVNVCWFDIFASSKTRFLSPGTHYSAYLVFKKVEGYYGFEDVTINSRLQVDGEKASQRSICFDGQFLRVDGWMEVELGEFFNDGLYSDVINMRVIESKGTDWKRGLIILGIEIRPAKIHESNAENTD